MEYAFNTFEKLINLTEKRNKQIYELMQEKEALDFEISVNDVRNKTKKIITAMKEAVTRGLKSREKSFSGLSGDDCAKLIERYKNSKSVFGKLFEKILCYSVATMEENLRMNTIAACPTAGSCGIVPAIIIALSEEFNLTEEEEINALITAGAIGYIISSKIAMAGAVAGCQAECGVAAAMASGAAVQIMKGNIEQTINAAALTLKNVLGLTCDPVAGLVEIPCIKRNAFMAVEAIVAAELSLAGVNSVIPPDEIVDALVQTGQLMSPLLKETSNGGLAATKTGLRITSELRKKEEL